VSYFSNFKDVFRKTSNYDLKQIDLAYQEFLSHKIEDILALIDDAFTEIKKYFSEKDIKKWYDIGDNDQTNKLNCYNFPYYNSEEQITISWEKVDELGKLCEFNKNDSKIDQLKNSIKYFLKRHYQDIKDAHTCLKIEKAINLNDVDEAKSLVAADFISNKEILCNSFLNPTKTAKPHAILSNEFFNNEYMLEMVKNSYPGFVIKKYDDFLITNFVNVIKIDNEASEIFSNYFIKTIGESYADEL
jgi:hypothetical protein